MKIKIEEDFPANRVLGEKYDCCIKLASYESLERVRKLPMVTVSSCTGGGEDDEKNTLYIYREEVY